MKQDEHDNCFKIFEYLFIIIITNQANKNRNMRERAGQIIYSTNKYENGVYYIIINDQNRSYQVFIHSQP